MKKIWIVMLISLIHVVAAGQVFAGATTANGWYEGEEIYYILGGVEEGISEKGFNQLYLIGGDRTFHTGGGGLHAPLECQHRSHSSRCDTRRYSRFAVCIGTLSRSAL